MLTAKKTLIKKRGHLALDKNILGLSANVNCLGSFIKVESYKANTQGEGVTRSNPNLDIKAKNWLETKFFLWNFTITQVNYPGLLCLCFFIKV